MERNTTPSTEELMRRHSEFINDPVRKKLLTALNKISELLPDRKAIVTGVSIETLPIDDPGYVSLLNELRAYENAHYPDFKTEIPSAYYHKGGKY